MRAFNEITYSQILPRNRTVQERAPVFVAWVPCTSPPNALQKRKTTYQTELRHMNSTLDIKFLDHVPHISYLGIGV
jgi:hypothetical protein